jgi:hypothetical protein
MLLRNSIGQTQRYIPGDSPFHCECSLQKLQVQLKRKAGLGTRNDCAGEGQHQFTRPGRPKKKKFRKQTELPYLFTFRYCRIAVNDMTINELEGIRKEAIVPYSRSYTGVSLEGLRKTTKNLNQGGRCSGRDLNRPPPEFKSRVLPLDQSVR